MIEDTDIYTKQANSTKNVSKTLEKSSTIPCRLTEYYEPNYTCK